jgi:YfiH family protein
MSWIQAQWPAPPRIQAGCTHRQGGHSQAPYQSLNLALHVDDHADQVTQNRHQLQQILQQKAPLTWLNQQHTAHATYFDNHDAQTPTDAIVSATPGQPCCVLTADCLPILLCDLQGKQVGAIHAGWQGLYHGIIANTLKLFTAPPRQLMAWIGPAICQTHYEVDSEFKHRFTEQSRHYHQAFKASSQTNKHLADLSFIATHQLQTAGLKAIYPSKHCTFGEEERFYSYRRCQKTGRIASCICINPQGDNLTS